MQEKAIAFPTDSRLLDVAAIHGQFDLDFLCHTKSMLNLLMRFIIALPAILITLVGLGVMWWGHPVLPFAVVVLGVVGGVTGWSSWPIKSPPPKS